MNTDGRDITEYIHKKVTNTVGAFFANENDGFMLSYTKLESEKVTDMVGTFCLTEAIVSCYLTLNWNLKR